MRDSDIDSLSADGAQEPYPTPRTAAYTVLGAYLNSADPIDAETAMTLLQAELDEAEAAPAPDALDRLGKAMENACDALSVSSLSPADAPVLHRFLAAASGDEE